jgi:uncharacterized protein YbaR (Trm112 family)
MIPQDLLDILVCPKCKTPLVLRANNQDKNDKNNDAAESLKCGQCRRVYPIRDGIPIMLLDEAVTEPA